LAAAAPQGDTVLEGEILPPERRVLLRPMKLLLFASAMLATIAMAHAADWQQRAKDAVTSAAPERQQCPLYIEQQDDQRIHVRVPVCFDSRGNVIMGSLDGEMRLTSKKPCEIDRIEGVERLSQTSYLVHTYCQGGKPEHETLVFDLLDDGDGGVIRITDLANS
jgi:hypothetical protein